MMDRRAFIRLAALGLCSAPVAAEAQPAGKVFRIGVLGTVPPTASEGSRLLDALLQGLRELGYIEGQNIVIERRYSEGRYERLPGLAAELVRLKVDVIVASSNTADWAKGPRDNKMDNSQQNSGIIAPWPVTGCSSSRDGRRAPSAAAC